MQFKLLVDKLKNSNQEALPAWEAHKLMAPAYRKNFTYEEVTPLNPKKASVLILLQEKEGSIFFPLILRNSYDGVHSDQVSFPGGKFEEQDKINFVTAKRETSEEIGIEVDKMNYVTQLSKLYIPPSNFLVTPFIAFLEKEVNYIKDKREVKKIIDISLDEILEDKYETTKTMNLYGLDFEVPIFNFQNLIIWGATAMILSEFKQVLKN
ncbi:MAG: CoA pyrophosphatase [Solirubrobacteraceae bacterium]